MSQVNASSNGGPTFGDFRVHPSHPQPWDSRLGLSLAIQNCWFTAWLTFDTGIFYVMQFMETLLIIYWPWSTMRNGAWRYVNKMKGDVARIQFRVYQERVLVHAYSGRRRHGDFQWFLDSIATERQIPWLCVVSLDLSRLGRHRKAQDLCFLDSGNPKRVCSGHAERPAVLYLASGKRKTRRHPGAGRTSRSS